MMFADRVMAHAEAHYNDGGWDVIVECWDKEMLTEILIEQKDKESAWRLINGLVDIWADRQADAINSAF